MENHWLLKSIRSGLKKTVVVSISQCLFNLKITWSNLKNITKKRKNLIKHIMLNLKKLDYPINDKNYEQIRNLGQVIKPEESKRFMKQILEDFDKKTSN